MGSILPHCALLHIQTYTMVATKVLISLCMLGLSAAATTVQRTKRQANQETAIVDTVVTSLQPQIATAVADALSALRRQQEAQEAAERAAYEAQLRAQQEAEARARAQQEAEERARLAALEAERAKQQEAIPASYNYQYQVRDDDSSTFIYKQEQRDGLDVTGTYGYVAPDGALITVNYLAGEDGFQQTLEREEGFYAAAGNGGRSTAPVAPLRPVAPAPAPRLDENALIAQIIAALQPQINSAVNTAISSSSSSPRGRSSVAVGGARGQPEGDRLSPLFGFA